MIYEQGKQKHIWQFLPWKAIKDGISLSREVIDAIVEKVLMSFDE